MTKKIALTIPGKPVPHVRMTRGQVQAMRGGANVNRQAQRYLAYKEVIGWEWKIQMAGVQPIEGDVRIHVAVHLVKPQSRRWDVSNVLKAVEDALNGLAYADDKQIVDARITVGQGHEDYVEVEMEEV